MLDKADLPVVKLLIRELGAQLIDPMCGQRFCRNDPTHLSPAGHHYCGTHLPIEAVMTVTPKHQTWKDAKRPAKTRKSSPKRATTELDDSLRLLQ